MAVEYFLIIGLKHQKIVKKWSSQVLRHQGKMFSLLVCDQHSKIQGHSIFKTEKTRKSSHFTICIFVEYDLNNQLFFCH